MDETQPFHPSHHLVWIDADGRTERSWQVRLVCLPSGVVCAQTREDHDGLTTPGWTLDPAETAPRRWRWRGLRRFEGREGTVQLQHLDGTPADDDIATSTFSIDLVE